jgi:uncharacterized protein (TIGR03437 family)
MRALTRVFPFLLACGLTAAAPLDRIHTIDNRETIELQNHVHPAAVSANDRGLVESSMPMNYMMLMVKPSANQQADLDRLLTDQQNPSSPNYRKWLTPEEFGNRFGLSASDSSKIVAWLVHEGFTVNDVARGRNWIAFSGTAEQVSRSLHTEIHYFEVNGEKRYANISNPQVPAALGDVIGGVEALNNFPWKHSRTSHGPNYTSTTGSHILTPQDYATIYDINALYNAGYDGTGQAIAVAEVGIVSLDDYHLFRDSFGLPANDPVIIPYSSQSLSIDGEGTLDVEWAGAVAPRAQMYYIYGPSAFQSLITAVNYAYAPIISISYYTCEGNASPPFYESVLQQANAEGLTVLTASGDGGGAGCFDQFTPFASHGPLLQFPAAVPEVTAVGGTMFVEGTKTYWSTTNTDNRGSALSYIPEAVWNESQPGVEIAASAGGPSTIYPKPLWQNGPGVPDDTARDVPDIALTAAGHDPYYVAQGGRLISTYGTSAASPSMAGILALLEQYQVAKGYQRNGTGLGNINPQLYRLAQAAPTAFHDIVTGDNKVPCTQGSPGCLTGTYGYAAGPGYDMATGLGSVDAYSFVTQFHVPVNSVNVTAAASPTRITYNDSVTLSVTVTAATKGAGVPTGSVAFTTSADVALGSGVLDANGTTSIAVPGWTLGTSGTGTYAVYCQYSGDVGFSGGGARALVTVSTPTGVSAIVPSASTVVWPNADTQGWVWQDTVTLHEYAGVASILTGFTIDGQSQPLAQYFPAVEIPASGSISSITMNFRNLASYPVTKTFGFTGVDAGGTNWAVQVQTEFLAPPTGDAGANPALMPLIVTENTSASCPWSQQLFIDETYGYSTSISSLEMGGVSMSSQIPAIFGTTRLFAWGSLSGTLCWNGVTPGTSSDVFIGLSSGQSFQLQVTFAGPPNSPVQMTAAPASIELSAGDATETPASTVSVTLSDKTQNWTASVFPANRTTGWLTLSQTSGAGSAQIKLQASGAGFEPGAYRATIVFSSANAVPQTVNVPVMFVLGGGSQTGNTVVSSVVNGASLANTASPGMIALINGSNLANSSAKAPNTSPQPYTLGGVTVNVNGIDAPLLAVSPTQLTVQIPYEVGAGPAVLGVNNNGQIAGYQFQVAPTAPAVFVDANGFASGVSNAVQGGKLSFTLTGFGDVTPSLSTGYFLSGNANTPSTYKPRLPLSVTVGGLEVFVNSYGLQPGSVGTTLVNITLLPFTPTGVQPLVVTVGGVNSPAASLNVAAAQ